VNNVQRRRIDSSLLSLAVGLLTFGIIAATPTSASAQGRARLRGEVTDAAGAPLEGVQVTAYNASFTTNTFNAETDEKGKWAILGFGNTTARWAFTFELDGYVTVEVGHTVQALGRNEDLDVTMEAATPVASAAAGIGADTANPENYRAGVAAFEAGDYAAALTSWNTFLADNPEAFPVWLRVAEAHVRLDDTAAAAAAYERVLALDGENQTALFMIAALKANTGELDEALGYFERVVAQDPENASLYYNIGEIYFQQSFSDEAITFYLRALEIDPAYADAHKQVGFAYVNTRQLDMAIASFERYLELVPADGEDAAIVGGLLEALKESQ
jgi:Tfp pilus assembly protein PilF